MILKAARATVASLLTFILIGCVTQPPPFDPHQFNQRARVDPAETPVRPKPPLPTTLETLRTEPAKRGSANRVERPVTGPTTAADVDNATVLRMSLREIVQRTVANNSEVRVAGYEPGIENTRIIEAQARFDPTFFISSQYENQIILSPTSSGFAPADPFNDPSIFRTVTGQTGIRQLTPSGGQASISYQLQRIDRDPEGLVNPYYANNLLLQLTQPLLRDFGNDVNRARITIAQNNRQISVLEFRRVLEENLAELEQLYWQMVQAMREVRIQEILLERTVTTWQILEDRREGGLDVSRVQTSQALAATRTREATLVRAKARVRDFSDEIKRRMNDPELPVSSPVIVLPANEPIEDPISFELSDQLETALRNRLELGQQILRVDTASITMRVARNNLFPQLNLTGSVGFQGVGEDVGDSFDNQADFENVTSAIGLEFEIPIGNRAARAIWRRSQLQRQQAIEQYRDLIDQIALDVSTALREIDTTWNEMVAARRARFAAADSLRALQQQEDLGEPLRPEFVQLKLDTQERLSNAAIAEATAISNYNIAISRLERSKGTLLRYNNVVLDDRDLPR